MAQFAKLFDVDDTQVLFMITNDDAGDIALKMITEVDGLEVAHCTAFKQDDQEAALATAQQILASLNQDSATTYRAKIVKMVADTDPEAVRH